MDALQVLKKGEVGQLELKTHERNRVGGLSVFIENRLVNNEFMRTHTIDDLKELARNFDKQGGSDLDQIFSKSVALVERVKSEHVQDYGKLWDDIKLGISSDNSEEIKRALYFFQEILKLNPYVQNLGFDIYDAVVLYYNLYLPKVLKTQEEFNQIENECRCRLIYIGINDLIPCPCGECKDNEMLKAYNKETQQRVESEFLESDIYKGLVLLRHATSLLKKRLPVKNLQDSLQKYNKRKLGLSADILTEVWRIAVGRAPKRVQMKVMTDIARNMSLNSSHFLIGQDGTVINLVKDDHEVEPSDLGIDPKSVEL